MPELGFFGNFIFTVLHWDTVNVFIVITFWLVFDFFFYFSILTLSTISSKLPNIYKNHQRIRTCSNNPGQPQSLSSNPPHRIDEIFEGQNFIGDTDVLPNIYRHTKFLRIFQYLIKLSCMISSTLIFFSPPTECFMISVSHPDETE